MNFFGHAVFAAWRSPAPGFVLGAMLPDFANMIGAREPRALADDVRDGIRFHHATDAVFHDAPTFRDLQSRARSALRELGLSRPSALAVGHIGVEFLLDASLARDGGAVRGYLEALELGRGAETADWGDAAANDRCADLCRVLRDRGVTPGAVEPGTVAYRVSRALASRPRLALEEGGERLVAEWAEAARGAIAASAPQLVTEVASGLAARGEPLNVPAF